MATITNAAKAVFGALNIDFWNIPTFSRKLILPIPGITRAKIKLQINPNTIPPIRFGVKKPARRKFCPLIPLVNIYARKNARTFTKTTTKHTYLNVSSIEDQNSASLKVVI